MTELDLLNLARATTANELNLFTQMITINFAMVVAIYYFLHQAPLAMKIFAFFAYLVGSLVYFGEMLIESNIKGAVITSMKARPAASLSSVSQYYLAIGDSWLTHATLVVFNGSFWILWIGIFYLLFFWKRQPDV